jgi:hypothetical protein
MSGRPCERGERAKSDTKEIFVVGQLTVASRR